VTAPTGDRVAVIGGGIVGLATAYRLLTSRPGARVVVFEKEARVGMHQSTHNSGVLHAGLHYAPGSLKARLARDGIREMTAYCRGHAIAHEICGKLVVATSPAEVERLRALHERGTANGLVGLRWMSAAEMREREPNAAGVAALHVPEEGIVDYRAVCDHLAADITAMGGEILTGQGVRAISASNSGWHLETTSGVHAVRRIINCAGLHADRVARLAGEHVDQRIVPFRGEYWTLRPERASLVKHLVYPVPDPSFPFLGVHLTRMIHGGVEAGPNAVLALAREGYRWRTLNLRDMADAASFAGLWRFIARYPRVATYEVARSLSAGMFLRSLQRLVPALRRSDLVRGPAGVRAQLMSRGGDLIQDFQVISRPGAVHVLNAPSPAATASLAIGAHIAQLSESTG
jgi:L-2-hydroxyglutarate oxidase